jgi:hypothetical protein
LPRRTLRNAAFWPLMMFLRRWRYPHVPFWTVAPDLSNRWG